MLSVKLNIFKAERIIYSAESVIPLPGKEFNHFPVPSGEPTQTPLSSSHSHNYQVLEAPISRISHICSTDSTVWPLNAFQERS